MRQAGQEHSRRTGGSRAINAKAPGYPPYTLAAETAQLVAGPLHPGLLSKRCTRQSEIQPLHCTTIIFLLISRMAPLVSVLTSMITHSATQTDTVQPPGQDTFVDEARNTGRTESNNGKPFHKNPSPEAPAPFSLSGVIEAIMQVGHQRKSFFDQMRSALVSGNDVEALSCARQLCGLTGSGTYEKSH
jgi:hypothetical protein